MIQIYPGLPWENGCNERFNGTLRREVLNAEWFTRCRGGAHSCQSSSPSSGLR
ncbi:MAG: integrase core domain-containing protein [Filomicrobium sp.]